jgi:hypothetical protein
MDHIPKNRDKLMNKVIRIALSAMPFALCFSVEASS